MLPQPWPRGLISWTVRLPGESRSTSSAAKLSRAKASSNREFMAVVDLKPHSREKFGRESLKQNEIEKTYDQMGFEKSAVLNMTLHNWHLRNTRRNTFGQIGNEAGRSNEHQFIDHVGFYLKYRAYGAYSDHSVSAVITTSLFWMLGTCRLPRAPLMLAMLVRGLFQLTCWRSPGEAPSGSPTPRLDNSSAPDFASSWFRGFVSCDPDCGNTSWA